MRPKKTVLSVDSNEQRLSCQVFLLETRGYNVLRAESCEEALKILTAREPETVHVLVCDLLMPEIDGNELVRRSKQLHPQLPAILFSNTVTSFDRALHAEVFLPKGGNFPAELVSRVRILAARKRGPKKQLTGPVWNPEMLEERVVA